jgi:hypothetical protein
LGRKFDNTVLIKQMRPTVARDAYLRFTATGELIGNIANQLIEDGHPSISPVNPQMFLSDTYEDREGYSHLFVYHITRGITVEIGRFHAPSRFHRSSFRCDLHPRWSPSGKLVCVDAIHHDRRQMFVLDVSRIVHMLSDSPPVPAVSRLEGA